MGIYTSLEDRLGMRKLAEKLKKIDIDLSKWTRDVLFEHLVEVCQDIKQKGKL